MIRITDKAFHYTPSFATDLKKRFKKMEQERKRALAADRRSPDSADMTSIIPIIGRHSALKA
jgi:hypothetical protein